MQAHCPEDFKPKKKEFDAYTDRCKAHAELEERRLMYVALTRAENELFVSSHWWGPTQRRFEDHLLTYCN